MTSEQGEEGVEEQELSESEMALLEANILKSSQFVAIVVIGIYAVCFSPHHCTMCDMFHLIHCIIWVVLEIRHFPRAQTQ